MGDDVKVKKRKKYKKRVLDIRQQKATNNLTDVNRSQGQALRDAGYSYNYANQPVAFAKTQAGRELVKTCNRIRDKSLKRAEDIANEANYGDVVRGADTLNKMSRLESGENTDNQKVELTFTGWKK